MRKLGHRKSRLARDGVGRRGCVGCWAAVSATTPLASKIAGPAA
jgi:hypothetical protein